MRTSDGVTKSSSRRGLVYVIVAVLILLGLGCFFAPQIGRYFGGDRAQETGVSDRLYDEVVHYQRDDGLFALPEAKGARDVGTVIHGTYLASRILGSRFSDAVTDEMRDRLWKYAGKLGDRPITQLEAYAVLKAAGDKRWRNGVKLAESRMKAFSREISTEQLSEYLDTSQVALQIEPKLKKSALKEFEPGNDEMLQRLAITSVALHYVFSNDREVRSMFPALQKRALAWARGEDSSDIQFLLSNLAAQASSVHSLSEQSRDARNKRLAGMRGCADAKLLLRAGGEGSTCSFLLTHIDRLIG